MEVGGGGGVREDNKVLLLVFFCGSEGWKISYTFLMYVVSTNVHIYLYYILPAVGRGGIQYSDIHMDIQKWSI